MCWIYRCFCHRKHCWKAKPQFVCHDFQKYHSQNFERWHCKMNNCLYWLFESRVWRKPILKEAADYSSTVLQFRAWGFSTRILSRLDFHKSNWQRPLSLVFVFVLVLVVVVVVFFFALSCFNFLFLLFLFLLLRPSSLMHRRHHAILAHWKALKSGGLCGLHKNQAPAYFEHLKFFTRTPQKMHARDMRPLRVQMPKKKMLKHPTSRNESLPQ